jgi:hypothetical protein
MDVVYPRCAGIDIGKADMKVCVRIPGTNGRRRGQVRTFSTMAAGVLEAADCPAPGLMETSNTRRIRSHGGTTEVPGRVA